MSNNNLIIGGIIILLIAVGTGFLVYDPITGILSAGGTEVYTFGNGSANITPPTTPPTTTTTTTTTTTSETISGSSTFAMGTGYIDSEGNWITPSAAAQQSVFYGGTTDEAIDIGVHPTITVSHSDDVDSLTSTVYTIMMPKIEAKMSTDSEYTLFTLHNEFLIITVPTLPADGGSLGETRVLRDILGIDATAESVDAGGAVTLSALETFLRAEFAAMELSFEPTTVDVTYTINVRIYIQVQNMIINYALIDGAAGVYECPSIFTKEIPLDVQFTIGALPPATPTFTFTFLDNQPYFYPVMNGYPVIIMWHPRTTGTPTTYVITLNGQTIDSGAWDGGDIDFSWYEINVQADAPYTWVCIVYVEGGLSATATSYHRGGMTAGGGDPPAQTIYITNVGMTMSIYSPSGSGMSTGLILIGAGVFALIVFAYWYKNNSVNIIKSGRRRSKKRR